MVERLVKIGLIGCGGISKAHVNGYKELYSKGFRAFSIRACCDVSSAAAEERAREVGSFQGSKPNVYSSFETMLKEEELDAVDICLPHSLHHSVAIRCMEERLHVIIEKPLAITMRAARRIIEAAERSGLVLAVAENYRFSPSNRAIRWVVEQGLIGEPRMIVWQSASWQPKPWGWRSDKYAAGGSWVFDGGVHFADLDRYHTRREPVEVYAVTETFEPVKEGVRVTVDDMAMAIIKYEGQLYAQWLWTVAAPGRQLGMRVIYGSKGAVDGSALWIQEGDRVRESRMDEVIGHMMASLSPEKRDRLFPRGITDTFALELYDFYCSVAYGRRPEVDGWEAYRDMAVPLGLYESAVLGAPVKVRDVLELRIEAYQGDINDKLGIK